MDRYQDILANFSEELSTKLGYPASLMSSLYGEINNQGIKIVSHHNKLIDNSMLGIVPNSLAELLINNVGSTWKDSESYCVEVKDIERESIEILGRYFGLPQDTARGYITSGGTEANFASMWWSKLWLINKNSSLIEHQMKEHSKYDLQNLSHEDAISYIKITKLIKDLTTPTVFFSQDSTHYSIKKICDIMQLDTCSIECNKGGDISLASLEDKLKTHIEYTPNKSIIMVANIGTTIEGAIDDIKGIKTIFEKHTKDSQVNYTIHADAACYGMIIPITKPFGDVENYFNDLGINTMTISGHKFLGTNILGTALTTQQFLEDSFTQNNTISYCGNIDDITISGCRPGLNILWLHNTMMQLHLDKSTRTIEKIVHHNLETARYLYDRLTSCI